jgi:hypothetical protein
MSPFVRSRADTDFAFFADLNDFPPRPCGDLARSAAASSSTTTPTPVTRQFLLFALADCELASCVVAPAPVHGYEGLRVCTS